LGKGGLLEMLLNIFEADYVISCDAS